MLHWFSLFVSSWYHIFWDHLCKVYYFRSNRLLILLESIHFQSNVNFMASNCLKLYVKTNGLSGIVREHIFLHISLVLTILFLFYGRGVAVIGVPLKVLVFGKINRSCVQTGC